MTEAEIKELIEFAYKNGWMDGICYPSTEKLNDKINDIYTRYQNDILDSKSLPSVTPQQKTGHWIKEEKEFIVPSRFYPIQEIVSTCSICNAHYTGMHGDFKYCPNCGAKMAESENT